jgi:Leucine-rich repeat (LRR) protein
MIALRSQKIVFMCLAALFYSAGNLLSEPPAEQPRTETVATAVRALRLDNTATNDAELEKICSQNPELVELTLGNTKITDAGLAHLRELKKLRKIRISKTAITDAGMSGLAKCETLEDVDVSQTKIGDNGVRELRALPRLKNLNLYLTLVTDQGLDSFRKEDYRSATKIERLNLDKCPITDSGLAHLASLKSLAWLHLGGTAITDAGLTELAKLETLKEAIVTKTETTLEGVETLRRKRPDMNLRDNVSEKTPQADIDEAAEYRKQLAPIREKGRLQK